MKQGKVGILLNTLRLIAGDRCSSYTSPQWACLSHRGRKRQSEYSADKWCDSCTAHDAIERFKKSQWIADTPQKDRASV